jgi:hypothetical protein
VWPGSATLTLTDVSSLLPLRSEEQTVQAQQPQKGQSQANNGTGRPLWAEGTGSVPWGCSHAGIYFPDPVHQNQVSVSHCDITAD